MNCKSKKSIVLFIFILLIINSLLSCKTNDIPEGSNLLTFDSAHWKSTLIDKELIILKNNDRQKMLENLALDVIPGKTKTEIIGLLGNPESVKFSNDKNSLTYITGEERGSYMSIDSEWFIIYFNENEIVSGYSIIND